MSSPTYHTHTSQRGRIRSPDRTSAHKRSRSPTRHSYSSTQQSNHHINNDSDTTHHILIDKPMPKKKILPWLKKKADNNKHQLIPHKLNDTTNNHLSTQSTPATPSAAIHTKSQSQSSVPTQAQAKISSSITASTQPYIKQVMLRTVKNTPAAPSSASTTQSNTTQSGTINNDKLIEIVLNDRLGKKVRVKCKLNDTILILKKLAAAQLGTRADKLRIQKWYTIYKDHIQLQDYEIQDGMNLELFYI